MCNKRNQNYPEIVWQILSPVCHIFVPCGKICDKFINYLVKSTDKNVICHIFLSFVPSLSQVCHVDKPRYINVWEDFTLKCDKFSKIANKMKNRKINLYWVSEILSHLRFIIYFNSISYVNVEIMYDQFQLIFYM